MSAVFVEKDILGTPWPPFYLWRPFGGLGRPCTLVDALARSFACSERAGAILSEFGCPGALPDPGFPGFLVAGSCSSLPVNIKQRCFLFVACWDFVGNC